VKTISLYYDYFKHQAENHVLLRHSDEAGNKVFDVIDIETALGDFRSGVKRQDYIFRLINYTYVITQDTHEATKEIQGGFLIARYYNVNANGPDDYKEAMDAAEIVVDDMIKKMIADSHNGHPLFDHYFDADQDITVQPVNHKGDGTYCGWMCIFRTKQYFGNCLEGTSMTRWDDNGQTPYEGNGGSPGVWENTEEGDWLLINNS
jgi:hypothetical protein